MADSTIYDNVSATLEPYQFQLYNPDTSEILTLPPDQPPLEWAEGVTQIERDIAVGGVFTSFVADSLTFIKKGASFLRSIWDEKEINGSCYLIVSYLKNPEGVYIELPSRFSLNFATAKPRVKVGNQAIGFLIDAAKDEILVKLENRRSTDIDISKREFEKIVTIGESSLLPYFRDPYLGLKTELLFDSTYLRFQSIWVSDYAESGGRVNNNDDYNVYTTFDMSFDSNEFEEAQEVEYKTDLQSVSGVTKFFRNSEESREVTLYYYFTIEVTNRKGGILNPQNVYATIIDVVDNTGEVKQSERVQDIGKNKGTFTADDSLTVNLAVGDSLRIYIKTDDTSGIDAYIRASQFRLVQEVVQFDSRTVESFPIYEAFERVLQHISDVQFPFYSEFFGRVDTVYNLDGDVYSSESQLRFASIMSGLNLRGASLFKSDNPLAISFDDLFNSANAIWNIGYEVEEIDGFKRIRIENYDYFFEDVEALDLSGRLTEYDIESESMSEYAYAEIISGFYDYSYETINGRGEFNTEVERTTVIETDSKYEIKSKLRGDTMGISEKIVDELDTEDSEEDGDMFIVKTQRGSDWVPEKEQNITIDENSSLFDDDSLNLYFTPARILKRHGNRIKGAFLKYLATSLSFQTSDKLQTLTTTGEGYTITENEDIPITDLDDPIYKPMKHIVTCEFTFDDLETFMQNPKGYITFSSDIRGYLLSLKKSNAENRATIEIIEKV